MFFCAYLFHLNHGYAQQILPTSTYRVQSLTLSGNETYDSEELKDKLNLHTGKVTTLGMGAEFNKRVLRLDVITLESFYKERGFINVAVRDSFYVKGNRRVEVFLSIQEGQRFFLRKIDIRGNLALSDQQVYSYFSDLDTGAPYNPYLFQESIEQVQQAYENTGKPFADIQYRIDAEGTNVFATIVIEENQTVYVEDIRINGLSGVKPDVVRRELTLVNGDRYSGEEIEESQRRIFETGLFADVNIRPVPSTVDSERVDLQVTLREQDFHTVRFDFGLGQYEITPSAEPTTGLESSLEWMNRNLVSSGRRLQASTGLLFDLINLNPWPDASISYTEPWLWKFRVPTTLRFFYELRTYDITGNPKREWGTDLTFLHTRRRRLTLRSTLTWQQVTLMDVPSESAEELLRYQDRQERSLEFLYRRDARDNFLYPKQGFVIQVEPKLFGGILGGTADFYKVEVSLSKYWESYFNGTLAGRINIGSLHKYNPNDPVIPDDELFRLGGATSVRGFQTDMLAVRYNQTDSVWVPQGKRVKTVFNLEYRFPLFWQFGGELFLDAGQLWTDYSNLDILSLRHTVGIGITFATPLGPARIDFGRKLNPRAHRDEETGRIYRDDLWNINLGLQYAF